MDIPGQNGEKRIQKPLEPELVGTAARAAFQHLNDDLLQFLAVPALKDQLPAVKPQLLQIFPCILSAKAYPQIGPWVLPVCLVEGLDLRLNQKALAFMQLILPVPGPVSAFALQNIVKNIIGPHSRTESMKGPALCIPAKAQIKIPELVTGQL